MKNGADALELDVRITKDKKVVIFHDPNLVRMANINKEITELNYADLPKLSESTRHHFSPLEFYKVKPGLDSRSIPLLEVSFK